MFTIRLIFVDIDECANTPCAHGGTCNDGINTYSCTCVLGYKGSDCEVGKLFLFVILI